MEDRCLSALVFEVTWLARNPMCPTIWVEANLDRYLTELELPAKLGL
jgi:hypothetical protein